MRKEGENFERLIEMDHPEVSYEFDELIDAKTDYFGLMRSGLILKYQGKFRGFMGNNPVTPYYDELEVNSSNRLMFSYKENGKYGATDGVVKIPAAFPGGNKIQLPGETPALRFDLYEPGSERRIFLTAAATSGFPN